MDLEKQQAQPGAEEAVNTESQTQDVNTSEETTEEVKTEESTSKVDYSAELEKELAIAEERAIKAEKALAGKRFKDSEEKREEINDVNDEDKPLTKTQLSEILAENNQQNQKIIEKQKAEDLAERLSSSEDEKKLVLAKWENITFPASYSLEEQIEGAYALANGKKLIAERDEALRALKGKDSVNKDTAETHIEPQPTKDAQVGGDIKTVIGRRGFVFNQSTKQYEKTTANGKKLIYDKKTGSVYPEGHKFA